MKRTLWILLLATVVPLFARAQSPVTWSFTQEPAADGTVRVILTATIEEGWHMYATKLSRDDGPLPTVIRFDESADHTSSGALVEPKAIEKDDPNFMMVLAFHEGVTVFSQAFQRVSKGAFTISGDVEFMVCNEAMCLPPKLVEFKLDIPAVN